ncbi:MAG: hypothetical protein ABIQ11_01990 [Saprospiraceae bacterium]
MYPIIKNSCRPEIITAFSLVLLCCIFFSSGCLTREEGCLDLAAVNFDFDADRACNECCTYPIMTMTLSQRWDSLNFNPSDTLADRNGLPYKIADLNYFLTSWSWKDAQEEVYTVDSAVLICPQELVDYTPDILIIDPQQFVYNLGMIRESPEIESIRFEFGLLPELECADETLSSTPAALSGSSPLWNPATSSLSTLRLVFQRDLNSAHLDTLYMFDRLSQQLAYDLDFIPGRDPALKLTVNYAKWFKDVDVNDPSSFTASILANVNESIFPTD